MSNLDQETFNALIDLLSPLMLTERQRVTLIARAFPEFSRLQTSLDYSGSARDFATLLVDRLVTYGKVHEKTALWVLLETCREEVGADKQKHIDTLRNRLNPVVGVTRSLHTADDAAQTTIQVVIQGQIERIRDAVLGALSHSLGLLQPQLRVLDVRSKGATAGVLDLALSPETAQTFYEVFAPYQTDTLFMLIGENPLPNYVAARLLLKPGGKLYLVHTPGTQDVAQSLRRVLDMPHTLLPIKRLNVGELDQVLKKGLGMAAGTIGLHYTGGTKIMAAHAYQAVKAERGFDAVYSYLDAESSQLVIEPGKDEVPAGPVRVLDYLDITLEQIMAMHGEPAPAAFQSEPRLSAPASEIARSAGVLAWQGYCATADLKRWDGRAWRDIRDELVDADIPAKIIDRLEAALHPAQPVYLDDMAEAAGLGYDRDDVIAWLRQGWLVDWTLTRVKAGGYPYHARNLGMEDSDFAIDVALMHSYKLVALCCAATPTFEEAKARFLDTYVHARRLGGDDVCVGLVCLADDVDLWQTRLQRRWDTRGDRMRVFGQEALADLTSALQDWLEHI